MNIQSNIHKVIIGDCILYHGDARQISLLDHEVDMICTDPPYKLTSGGRTGQMGGKLSPKNYDNKGEIVECKITWPEIWQVIDNFLSNTKQAHIYCMANDKNQMHCQLAGIKAGFPNHNTLVWVKNNCVANRWYMKSVEFTLFHRKGKAFRINDCGSRQDYHAKSLINSPHKTQKPVELMTHYIHNSSQPNQIVADPFMGSGSTLVAAIREGRKAIGVESDWEIFKYACERVKQAYEELS